MVGSIHDIKIGPAVYRNTHWIIEPSGSSNPIRRSWRSRGSSQSRHHACRGHLPNRMAIGIRHINIRSAIHGNTWSLWIVKSGGSANPIRRSRSPRGSSQSRYGTRSRNFSDRTVVSIRHIHIRPAIHCNALGIEKLSIGSSAICRSEPPRRSRQGRYGPQRRNHSDRAIISIHHIHIRPAVHRYARGSIKLSIGSSAIRRSGNSWIAHKVIPDIRRYHGNHQRRRGRSSIVDGTQSHCIRTG